MNLGMESESIEFKKSTSELVEGVVSLSAMLNKVASNQNLTFKMLKGLYLSNDIKINNEKFEENLGLKTADNKYNYMAELLADSNDVSIKVVTFAGTDKSVMLKRTEYGGKCLLLSVNNVLEYMSSINETKVKVGGPQRIEENYFDFSSFKEAWLNACIHTKWSEEIPPAVYIYDDRIEIVSNGGLPSALTKEDFFAGVSKPVNKKLLKIFGDLDYIDQTGHGIPLILKNYGKEAFYISEHTIIVTIALNKVLLESVEQHNSEYSDLNESENIVLSLIKSSGHYRTSDFMELTNYSEPYINKILRSLKDKGYIERIGANKNGYWQVVKS